MTSEEKRARVKAVTSYLEAKLPGSRVSVRDFAPALTLVFCVVRGYDERQLEFSRPVFDEAPDKLTALLTQHEVPATMTANAGKRIRVSSEQDTIKVSVGPLMRTS